MNSSGKTIKKLPEHLIHIIAAGEVITSVYSIIKELIENSIDANSTNISIGLNNKSSKYIGNNIFIKDNGDGVKEEDLELLCTNNCSSKINNFLDDFDKIESYGFRGEALYSISLISKIIKVRTICKKNIQDFKCTSKTINDGIICINKDINILDNSNAEENSNTEEETSNANTGNVNAEKGSNVKYNVNANTGNVNAEDSSNAEETSNANIGFECLYQNGIMFSKKKVSLNFIHGTEIFIESIFHNNLIRKNEFIGKVKEFTKVFNLIKCYDSVNEGIKIELFNSEYYNYNHNYKNNNNFIDIVKENFLNISDKVFYDFGTFKDLKKISTIYFKIIFYNNYIGKNVLYLMINKRKVNNFDFKKKLFKNKKNIFIFISLISKNVDVNIHPSKDNVLLQNNEIFDHIAKIIETKINTDVLNLNLYKKDLNGISIRDINDMEEIKDVYNTNLTNNGFDELSYQKIYTNPKIRELIEVSTQQRELSGENEENGEHLFTENGESEFNPKNEENLFSENGENLINSNLINKNIQYEKNTIINDTNFNYYFPFENIVYIGNLIVKNKKYILGQLDDKLIEIEQNKYYFRLYNYKRTF